MYYSRTHNEVKLGNGWIIDCVTVENKGKITYEVNALMGDVPWKEEVSGVKNIETKEEANKAYKEMVLKYKYL